MQKYTFFIRNSILPIYVCGVGLSCFQPGIRRNEGYPDYQWIQTRRGSGFLEFNDMVYEVGENQGFLIPPNCKHAYYPSEKGWIQDFISFNGKCVNLYFESLKLNYFQILSFQNNVITLLIDKIMNTKSAVQQSAQIVEVLYHISNLKPNSGSNIDKVTDFIQSNFNRELTLNDMAKQLGISPQHMCKIFANQMNMRPFEYLNQVRIQKSKEYLLFGSIMPLQSISSAVGFSSSSYFCKTFKRYEGISPGKFREQFRN